MSHEEIMEQFPAGVFLVNTRWQVSYFNRTAQKITGYSRDEALGKFCWDIFRSDLCHKKCPMRLTMSTGQDLLDQEVEIRTKAGQKKLILVRTAQIKKPGNRVLGGVETFSDLECLQHSMESKDSQALGDIVGVSPRMQEIIQQLPTIAASDSNVLILGEPGTGKELIARALHTLSPRRKGPFQAVTCSAVPETLLESELFGYERGAFTGAVSSKAGKFELAKGGTLFLDEIGDLRPDLQVKLLRVLEGRGFERVGGNRKIPLEARILAATNVGRAFLEGAKGLLLIGCNPEECHHSYGIDHTWSRVWVLKKLLSLCGLERARIALAHSDITQPNRFVTTVESFMKTMATLGPIVRDAETRSRLQALYDALQVSRVCWVLGVSLRRPWETAYPSHMPNPAAYDHTLTEILTEEFFRARVKNLMRRQRKLLQLHDITQALGVDEVQAHEYLKDMGYEAQIAISFVNRTRFYGLPSGPQ